MLTWVIRALRAIKRFLKYQIVRGINKLHYKFYHVGPISFQDPCDVGAFKCLLYLSVAAVTRDRSQGQSRGADVDT